MSSQRAALVLALATGAADCGGGQTGRDEWDERGRTSVLRDDPRDASAPPAIPGPAADSGGDLRASAEVPAAGNDLGAGGVAATDGAAGTGGAGTGRAADAGDEPDASGPGTSGGATGSGNGGGSGGAGGAGGSSGSGGAAPFFTCPDLDGNRRPDCEESLVMNSGFNHDGSGWKPLWGGQAAFDPRDASGLTASGSLAVANLAGPAAEPGRTWAGSGQCVAVTGATTYEFYAQSFTLGGPEADGSATAVGVQLFESPDCGESPGTAYLGPVTPRIAAWTLLRATAPAPSTVKSIQVRLLVQKSASQPAVTALFDNVLVKGQ